MGNCLSNKAVTTQYQTTQQQENDNDNDNIKDQRDKTHINNPKTQSNESKDDTAMIEEEKMFKIFKENGINCNGKSSSSSSIVNKCDYVHRLILSLKFYQTSMKQNSKPSLKLFLSETYPAHLFIDDIKHYKKYHCNDNEDILIIKNELINLFGFSDCKLSDCSYSLRHFGREKRIKKEEQKNDNSSYIDFYTLQLDNFHFNLMHLFDSGFRILPQQISPRIESAASTAIDCSDEGEGDDNIDSEYLLLSRYILNKRDEFNRFKSGEQEFDDDGNNKYNINFNMLSSEKTFIDHLYSELADDENGDGDETINRLSQFFISEEFDSDAIFEDLDDAIESIYLNEEKEDKESSNIYLLLDDKNNMVKFKLILDFLIKYKG